MEKRTESGQLAFAADRSGIAFFADNERIGSRMTANATRSTNWQNHLLKEIRLCSMRIVRSEKAKGGNEMSEGRKEWKKIEVDLRTRCKMQER